MKSTKITILGLAVAALTTLASCGDGSSASKKGEWKQSEREEFMKDCVSSAMKSYEQRGQQGDPEIIKNICKCSGEILEKKYSYKESSKIAPEEIKSVMAEAVKNCGTKK